MARKKINYRRLSAQIAVLGDDKFGGDITVLDLSSFGAAADYLILISVYSHPQLDAVLRHITDELEKTEVLPLRKETVKGGNWAVLDYGGAIAHVMTQQCREFYRIERLWPEAKKLRWKRK